MLNSPDYQTVQSYRRLRLLGTCVYKFQKNSCCLLSACAYKMSTRHFNWESVVRGHIYKDIWTPLIGEILFCDREEGNSEDSFAISVIKDGNIVGHVPREASRIVWYFIEHGGSIDCHITGWRKHGKGLVVPCAYRFHARKSCMI